MVYISTVVCLGTIPIEKLDIPDLLRRRKFKESLLDVFYVIEDITENKTDRHLEPCQELVARSEEFIINNPVNILSSNIENLFQNDQDINLISTGINYRRVITISALVACAWLSWFSLFNVFCVRCKYTGASFRVYLIVLFKFFINNYLIHYFRSKIYYDYKFFRFVILK